MELYPKPHSLPLKMLAELFDLPLPLLNKSLKEVYHSYGMNGIRVEDSSVEVVLALLLSLMNLERSEQEDLD